MNYFAIQLEAMQTANVRGYLKQLVIDSIDQFFDQDTYDKIQSEIPRPSEINALVRTQIQILLGRLNEEEDDAAP